MKSSADSQKPSLSDSWLCHTKRNIVPEEQVHEESAGGIL